MSPTHQDLSNDTTFSQIKSSVPVPLKKKVPYHTGTNVKFRCEFPATPNKNDFIGNVLGDF